MVVIHVTIHRRKYLKWYSQQFQYLLCSLTSAVSQHRGASNSFEFLIPIIDKNLEIPYCLHKVFITQQQAPDTLLTNISHETHLTKCKSCGRVFPPSRTYGPVADVLTHGSLLSACAAPGSASGKA